MGRRKCDKRRAKARAGTLVYSTAEKGAAEPKNTRRRRERVQRSLAVAFQRVWIGLQPVCHTLARTWSWTTTLFPHRPAPGARARLVCTRYLDQRKGLGRRKRFHRHQGRRRALLLLGLFLLFILHRDIHRRRGSRLIRSRRSSRA